MRRKPAIRANGCASSCVATNPARRPACISTSEPEIQGSIKLVIGENSFTLSVSGSPKSPLAMSTRAGAIPGDLAEAMKAGSVLSIEGSSDLEAPYNRISLQNSREAIERIERACGARTRARGGSGDVSPEGSASSDRGECSPTLSLREAAAEPDAAPEPSRHGTATRRLRERRRPRGVRVVVQVPSASYKCDDGGAAGEEQPPMQIGRTPMMHVPARRRQPEVAYVIPPEPMIAFPHIARERSMHETKRPGLVFAISVAAVAVFGAIGNATEAYPTRPITMVVPYPAAGLFDALARVLAEPMRKALGQSVVIENVGGASGSIAAGRVARAAPGRLHDRHRLRRSVRRQCRDLPAPVRRGEGLRTGRAGDERTPSRSSAGTPSRRKI